MKVKLRTNIQFTCRDSYGFFDEGEGH